MACGAVITQNTPRWGVFKQRDDLGRAVIRPKRLHLLAPAFGREEFTLIFFKIAYANLTSRVINLGLRAFGTRGEFRAFQSTAGYSWELEGTLPCSFFLPFFCVACHLTISEGCLISSGEPRCVTCDFPTTFCRNPR